eukprot:s10665_g1.t1
MRHILEEITSGGHVPQGLWASHTAQRTEQARSTLFTLLFFSSPGLEPNSARLETSVHNSLDLKHFTAGALTANLGFSSLLCPFLCLLCPSFLFRLFLCHPCIRSQFWCLDKGKGKGKRADKTNKGNEKDKSGTSARAKSKAKKTDVCHHCGKKGHWACDCWLRQAAAVSSYEANATVTTDTAGSSQSTTAGSASAATKAAPKPPGSQPTTKGDVGKGAEKGVLSRKKRPKTVCQTATGDLVEVGSDTHATIEVNSLTTRPIEKREGVLSTFACTCRLEAVVSDEIKHNLIN